MEKLPAIKMRWIKPAQTIRKRRRKVSKSYMKRRKPSRGDIFCTIEYNSFFLFKFAGSYSLGIFSAHTYLLCWVVYWFSFLKKYGFQIFFLFIAETDSLKVESEDVLDSWIPFDTTNVDSAAAAAGEKLGGSLWNSVARVRYRAPNKGTERRKKWISISLSSLFSLLRTPPHCTSSNIAKFVQCRNACHSREKEMMNRNGTLGSDAKKQRRKRDQVNLHDVCLLCTTKS